LRPLDFWARPSFIIRQRLVLLDLTAWRIYRLLGLMAYIPSHLSCYRRPPFTLYCLGISIYPDLT
jgi:hypothetical protein